MGDSDRPDKDDMTTESKMTLGVLLFTACTAGAQDDPDNLVGDPVTPPPLGTVSPPVSTPFEGYIRVGGPGQYQDGGASGVSFGIQLNSSLPGGVSCYWGSRVGNCCYQVHRPNEAPPQSNAGTIHIANLTHPTWNPALYAYLDPGEQYILGGNFPNWNLGDTLSVSASGDDIHAFSATVVVPPPLTGAPAEFVDVVDSGSPVKVSLAHDWSVAWTPAGGNFVQLTMWTLGSGEVECRADDADGQIVIPEAILNQLARPHETGEAYITRIASSTIKSDNLTATFEAELSDLSANIEFIY
jgi:hypothetical protein